MNLLPHLRSSLVLLAAVWLMPFVRAEPAQQTRLLEPMEEPAPASYRAPPSPIPEILDAPRTPAVSVNPNRSVIALLGRQNLPPIEELATPELALAGTRINPATNGPSRSFFYRSLTFQDIATGEHREVELPDHPRLGAPQWSPDGTLLAFTNTVDDGVELWVAEVATADARRVVGPELNASWSSHFAWDPDSRSLLVQRIPPGRGEPPTAPPVPSGPVIQENAGPAAPVRTYQNLLSNKHDESLFEYYFTSRLTRVPATGGSLTPVGEAGIFGGFNIAPGGEYLLVTELKRPFSYAAPAFAFSRESYVIDSDGKRVYQVHDRIAVTLPRIGRDMVNPEPRRIQWRKDVPATLVWAEPMDGGDARSPAQIRDRVFMLEAPFDEAPRTLIDLDQRFVGIHWGREDLALVRSYWRTNSRTKTLIVDPSDPGSEPSLLWDRSAEDRYGDPGTPLTQPTETGERLLLFAEDKRSIFLRGDGASPDGDFPFLDRIDLETRETERLWQAETSHYEYVVALLDNSGDLLLTRRESNEEPPNYFSRDLQTERIRALTDFPDPAPQLAGLQRQIITYPREDGTMLSAKLYTPPGFDAERDGPLPVLLWAYPREFRDADAASQLSDSPNRFSRPYGSSPLFLLTQGYAILDGATVPIIGVGDDEPNDTYIEQLVSSARAVVDKVVEMGVGDPDRIAVGGHSYGAFMAANLLAHSDLFSAGIARSGAYNRSLTPFGFQAEPRSYWEAQDVYLQMSPFNHAHKITAPTLLVHGADDNNSGTFPIQSERMFQALKGHGVVSRLVMLPHESHGYVARESVLHVLAETIDWLDGHMKETDAQVP